MKSNYPFEVVESKGGQLMLFVFQDESDAPCFAGQGYQNRHSSLSHDLAILVNGNAVDAGTTAAPEFKTGKKAAEIYDAAARFGGVVIANEEGIDKAIASEKASGEFFAFLSVNPGDSGPDGLFLLENPYGPVFLDKNNNITDYNNWVASGEDRSCVMFYAPGVLVNQKVECFGTVCHPVENVFWHVESSFLSDEKTAFYVDNELVEGSCRDICDWSSPVFISESYAFYSYERAKYYSFGDKCIVDDRTYVEAAIQDAADTANLILIMHYNGCFELVTLDEKTGFREQVSFFPFSDNPVENGAFLRAEAASLKADGAGSDNPAFELKIKVFADRLLKNEVLRLMEESLQ